MKDKKETTKPKQNNRLKCMTVDQLKEITAAKQGIPVSEVKLTPSLPRKKEK